MGAAGARASSALARAGRARTTKGRGRSGGRARPESEPRPRAGSTRGSERLPEPLEAASPDGDDFEARLEVRETGIRGQPRLRGTAEAALLLRADHLERIAVAPGGLGLHLDERQPAPAPDDEVELIAAGPDVRLQDPIAAQAVEPPRPPLGRPAARPLLRDEVLVAERLEGPAVDLRGTDLPHNRGMARRDV